MLTLGSDVQVTNANVGTLPKVMCYLAVHPVHGTHAFFPYHGARHGIADKEAGKMYDTFIFWWHGMEQVELKKIIKMGYCNTPSAWAKLTNPPGPDDPFDPHKFLVSYSDLICFIMLNACLASVCHTGSALICSVLSSTLVVIFLFLLGLAPSSASVLAGCVGTAGPAALVAGPVPI